MLRIIPNMPAAQPAIKTSLPPDTTGDDACYLALKTRDARFDGRFFTAVTSTGIYCRPVCKVRCPKRENCRFFPLAAQAEQAGLLVVDRDIRKTTRKWTVSLTAKGYEAVRAENAP